MKTAVMKVLIVLMLGASLVGCAGQGVKPQTSASPEATFPAPYDRFGDGG